MSAPKPVIADTGCVEIRIKGKPVSMSSACIQGRTVVAGGRWIKVAHVLDEELVEGEAVVDPESFTSQLKAARFNADIFTFAQKLPEVKPKYPYHLEWDNAAVIPITTFSEWWQNRAQYDVRKAVKRAGRVGVMVKEVNFDHDLVRGIRSIYDESPIRQGRPFWHYQKDFDSVKLENSTYLERSAFIGAYFEDVLIGFIRMVYVGTTATTLQVIAMKKHQDKKPVSALIAKAVEICEGKGLSHLVYGRYVYNDAHSSLTEFKRRNGFEQVLLPRYYVPLTAWGRMALALNLHHRWTEHIGGPVLSKLRKVRTLVYQYKSQSATKVR